MTVRSYRGSGQRYQAPFLTGFAHPHPIHAIPTVPQPFIGYTDQQRQIAHKLALRGVVAVSGMVGSGKTALAAAHLQRCKLASHWIEIEPGLNDSIDAFLWELAQPLATGAPTIWRALHRVQQSSWHYPTLIRFQMILDGYTALPAATLVCVDRVERVAQSPLERVIVSLCDYVAQTRHTNLKLLVSGRTLPYDLHTYSLPLLEGLSVQDIELWAERIGLPLDHPVAMQIYMQTGGLPQAVSLILTALHESESALTSEHLMAFAQLRRFVNRVLSEISAESKVILKRLVLGVDKPAEIDFDNLPHLDHLEWHGLIQPLADSRIVVHPLIQSFVMYHLNSGSSYG
jgi:hypothetical protein